MDPERADVGLRSWFSQMRISSHSMSYYLLTLRGYPPLGSN